MTALCGGGNSGPKLGTAAIVDVGAGYVALMMEKSGIPWLEFAAPLAVIPPLVLANFCSSDPPAMTALTQAESDALLNLTLGSDFNNGLGKLPAIIENLYWNEFCQCNSGSYTPPSYPAQPSGSTTFVPTPNTSNSPCATATAPDLVITPGQTFTRGGVAYVGLNATSIDILLTNTVHAAPGFPVTWTFQFLNGSVSPIVYGPSFVYSVPSGSNQLLKSVQVPAGYDQILGSVTAPAGSGSMDIICTCNAYCNGQTSGCGPCSAPDVATQRTLQYILDIVQSMQRNYAPFAYVKGAPHSGLTGSGSITVSRAIGVQVAITTYPATLQQLAGNPAYVKDMGWISVSEADGMIQERRVSQLAFTWFPQLAPLATQINYDFFPGVTATITPLLAED